MQVRYVIKFTKESEIRFISHLDLMRTIQRIIRRGKLPVEYSKGFNPHMNLSLAQPLSVGVYSSGEYLDVVFTEEVEEKVILEKLNESSPRGIRFLEAIKVGDALPNERKIPQVMALLDGASYKVKIKYSDTTKLNEELKLLEGKEQWTTVKKSKSGEKEVDIKAMIKEFNYNITGNTLEIDTLLPCGSRESLSPELLSNYIKANTNGAIENSFVDIMRVEMYTLREGQYVAIDSYFNNLKR
ncbi:TIGR03936 family radical SAM-associated protein [Clostridium thermarum]|uniref:TIGR03936 family radical SAM-associated protein n=1 Tax=Clostridium thermarum TaxID=1716543 RepID=UPI0015D67544|nr:TIGR03936 family radical SAM-associated protein [Clostridium thermarum]